ncbi:lipopolysaccharide transport periplasmic protein LptA [Litorivicinus sp.]|nr:lipopolysaccharide transport periplasmic protein LptA [Litorivicinus sp.]MDC1208086.1 lipopolysaccharide transport periplasmic protein LptA [Litorivicinus sp.]MDC1466162.1 lipopolysaccharide transport periplasmic protein LptA [Litorivicinus sp.]
MAKYTFIIISLIASSAATALPTDRDEPIEISANSAVINEKENLARYQGAVILTQGTFKLTGEKIDLTTNSKGEVKTFVAIGMPARFENLRSETDEEPVSGLANRIDYSYAHDRVTLRGDAKVKIEGSEFAGPDVSYELTSGVVNAAGDSSKRVNMTMQPKKK